MALPQPNLYTIEDIYTLPEGTRAELIDGQLYYMAPPSRRHQELTGELYASIYNFIKANGGSCKPYIAPFAVFLNADDKNYVEPDISVICDPDRLTDRGCTGAPDWIIEITSPSNPAHDHVLKLHLYMDAGVREYWIVNPEDRTVQVMLLDSKGYLRIHEDYGQEDTAVVNVLEGCTIDLTKVFSPQ